ncbi:hypothetical protein N7481_003773 [Penicillium waksmanii]|uniref:uncharacterized protein n=1 Tax=Penicillium waksmanii TaxID=69791 RepID=UPI00254865B4|nr:uncharacterized protein N7481_003773 [Penicillium waksmanii]KAJ5988563.1 hypothetical protein N7481_003773 [Penicillium waksmanii]
MDFSELNPTASQSSPNGPEITEYFGPRIMTGPRREYKVSRNASLNPKIGTPVGITAEAGGLSRTSEVIHTSRWMFTGTRHPEETPDKSQTRRSCFRRLIWHLEENKLDDQAVQQPTVHSAVTIHHGSQPFLLDLKIEAKMHRWRDRIKQSFILPPRSRKSYTRSLIEPRKEIESDESFRETVLGLEQAMIDKNLHPVPGRFYRASGSSVLY